MVRRIDQFYRPPLIHVKPRIQPLIVLSNTPVQIVRHPGMQRPVRTPDDVHVKIILVHSCII